MARKLKTFQTSLGFFDLAIAAPSMKAALEAWDADSNLFHQGAAKQSDDPDVVAATMAKPGVVLKRPAGSNGRFAEHSDLPSDLGSGPNGARPEKRRPKPGKRAAAPEISERDARKAADDFEKEQKRREAERRREEAVREKKRKRREKATVKAQTTLDKAEREHLKNAAALQAEREVLEQKSQAEDTRWDKERGGWKPRFGGHGVRTSTHSLRIDGALDVRLSPGSGAKADMPEGPRRAKRSSAVYHPFRSHVIGRAGGWTLRRLRL